MASANRSNITHSSGKMLVPINGSQLPLKLNTQNYSTWRAQIRHGPSCKWGTNKSATRILSLREKLSKAKRDSRPISEYLQFVKSITEERSLCGSPVADVDLVVHVLSGVGTEFHDIAAAIHARDTVISFDEL
ncbi:hypothetical protein P3X46_012409 [Hevea brasiliensis]|uniref:Retrotransposon Copia-like N-terminal domain-containing protein n=1 Tax=Hevea brasiliensis TaxID=3981 RepID=A0ABQ9MCA4_HEVBR|nr:hypothetical protein P3X46_012409 [Hevea brasiliensis]